MFTEENISNYYINNDTKDIYQMIGWCSEPTAILKNLNTGNIKHIVYNCQNANLYKKLVVEKED